MPSSLEAQPIGSPTQFPCSSCGASLHFAPGLNALKCPYCGTENLLPEVEEHVRDHAVTELDFHAYLSQLSEAEESYVVTLVKCSTCGAETTFDANITADECAFCGTALVAGQLSQRLLKPRALLPFRVTDQQAFSSFQAWIAKLWFAPNDLKKRAHGQRKLSGLYLPHWTFDTLTTTPWRGQRGEHYYETQTYVQDGKTRTRTVRKTRWYPASGRVDHFFDDVLVCASDSLPRKYTTSLEPWDLQELVPYDEAYLSGFRSERYTVALENGWDHARERIDEEIDQMIRRQIGGDEQRIHWKDTRYDDITFKHILLPVWLSTYRYKDKVYRFMVNARTGEVQGERPWSWVKITLLVLLILIIAVIFFYFYNGS